ncbi:MAG: NAD(P)-binding protein [Candidatus Obscuribacterales bacterium]|nr:NAD(P)-binding protein [Candidatus Obscuribacterales bacterium]
MDGDDSLTRRSFLQTAGLLAGAVVLGEFFDAPVASSQSTTTSWHYETGVWTGDDFTVGHEMRDAEFPKFPVESEKTIDFAIIGGGIAGLTAAHYLNNYNYMLFEQYADLGGQCRGQTYQGLEYSFGGTRIDVPQGSMEQLLDELNLQPVILQSSQNRFKLDTATEKYWQFLSAESKRNNEVTRDLAKFITSAKPIWQLIKDGLLQIPLIDADLSKLDSSVFKDSLTAYSPTFVALLDSMCRVNSCLGVDKISALAGYATTVSLAQPTAVFKGGNTAITKALVASLQDSKHRCLTESFVWAIEIAADHAMVIYSDNQKRMHKVKCRHVIVTSPPLVAARILRNIDDTTKAKMLSFKYGSYLVANYLLKTPVMAGCATNWLGTPYGIKEAFLAETPYQQLGEYSRKMGSVMTLYQPFAPGSEGRTLLLEGDQAKLTKNLCDQLEPVCQNLATNLEKVILSRWGHAMVATNANFFNKMTQLSAALTDNSSYSLAHNSVQGMPKAESAVAAARAAVDKALVRKLAN